MVEVVDVSILICTYGDPSVWHDLAWSQAYPSARDQGEHEIIVEHDDEMYLDEVRNMAAERATGEWLCFLDADDQLAPGYLAAMELEWLRLRRFSPITDVLLVPSVQYVHPSGLEEQPRIPQKGRWPVLNVAVIGTLIRRELFGLLGGFRALPSLEDFDLWIRANDAGADLVYVEDAVYRAYVSPDSRNSNQSTYDRIWADHLARIQ